MGLNAQLGYKHTVLYSCVFVSILFRAVIEMQYIAIFQTLVTLLLGHG
jgi:hypothetical protein